MLLLLLEDSSPPFFWLTTTSLFSTFHQLLRSSPHCHPCWGSTLPHLTSCVHVWGLQEREGLVGKKWPYVQIALCWACRSVVSDSVTLWTVACKAPLSMGFSRPECSSGLPCPPPGHLSNPGIKPRSATLQADSLLSELKLLFSWFSMVICLSHVCLVAQTDCHRKA